MNTVKVMVADLVSILEENKKKHVEEYHAALDGYAATWVEELDKQADRLQEKRNEVEKEDALKITTHWSAGINLPHPRSYEKDYDRAIGMLNLHTVDTIELNHREYDQFVLDEWDWKDEVATSNSLYASKTTWTS